MDAPGRIPVTRTLTIRNQKGLHARAAAKFVKLSAQFDATVEVTRHGTTVGADSIMGLMMLAAGQGAEIEVSATGPDAEAAIDALDDLLRRRFDED